MSEAVKQFNQAAARFNEEWEEKFKIAEEWSFVDGLKKFMERKKLTKRELGRKLGLSHMAVVKWLSKESEPNLTSLKNLIRIGMKSNEIFGSNLSRMMFSKR